MWKCVMCETNNSDDSEECLICFTSKVDSKKYFDKLKNSDYMNSGDVKKSAGSSVEEHSHPAKVASIPRTRPHKMKTSESIGKFSDKLYGESKEWVDSLEDHIKHEEKMKFVNICSTFERIFMIILCAATIVFLSVSMNTFKCESIFDLNGVYYIIPEIVQLYLTIRCVKILNIGKIKKILIKMMIWMGFHALFEILALIGLTIIRLL